MVSSEYKVVSIILGLGTQSKKKIEKFGGFILKGGRGSFPKPNFIIPLIWDILGRREGVKSLISHFLNQFN